MTDHYEECSKWNYCIRSSLTANIQHFMGYFFTSKQSKCIYSHEGVGVSQVKVKPLIGDCFQVSIEKVSETVL